MIKVLIVEDDDLDFNRIDDFLSRFSKDEKTEFEITRVSSGLEFSKLDLKPGQFDLTFFDVDLKDANGIELSKKLRDVDQKVTIIFVTNLAQFAIRGYEVEALDYVVKPVEYFDFLLKIKKALTRIEKNVRETYIINSQKGVIKVAQSEIIYVEIMHHKLIFHTTHGDYIDYGSLKEIESKLNSNVFKRCNSCYLVNLNYVKGIDGYNLNIGGEILQISHPKKKEFMREVNKFYNEVI